MVPLVVAASLQAVSGEVESCLQWGGRLRILRLSYPLGFIMAAPVQLTTVVSTKGQVILPKTLREERRWGAGTRLVVEATEDGILLKAAPVFAPTRPEDVFASLPFSGTTKSLEEMDAGIAAEAKRRYARDRY